MFFFNLLGFLEFFQIWRMFWILRISFRNLGFLKFLDFFLEILSFFPIFRMLKILRIFTFKTFKVFWFIFKLEEIFGFLLIFRFFISILQKYQRILKTFDFEHFRIIKILNLQIFFSRFYNLSFLEVKNFRIFEYWEF